VTSLVAEGIVKSFGRQPVLTGFDLDVPEGALAAIVGPSGSGKTTFLRVAAGFERADAGRLLLGDLVVDGERYVPPEERGIGYVPQEGALFPHLSVRRNIGFGLSRAVRSARVEELLALVGLAGLGRRYPHQLSGGQQQRVALARALAIRPKVVLLDEPFSSLDAGLRASVRAEVGTVLRAAGTTTVLVTHDQDEALSFADVVAVLRDGKVAQVDTPSRLYRRPLDAGVAAFVGQANVVEGVVVDGAAARSALGALVLAEAPAGAATVSVLVRPEQLRLAPAAGGEAVTGVVMHEEYYGHDAIVRVRVGEGAGAIDVVARIAGEDPPPLGSRVSLQVVGACRAWPAG
jgi:iron(III) transport system ATP-binding protein